MNDEYIKRLKFLANNMGDAFVKCTFTDTHENTLFRQQLVYILGFIDGLPEGTNKQDHD